MKISEFRRAANHQQIDKVRFIESSCSPMVIELTLNSLQRELLKNDRGEVITCKNITQAYDICREHGIHEAELVQVIPHDEACAGQYIAYDQQSMPLKF